MATNEEIIQSLYRSFFSYLISVNPSIAEGSTEYIAIDNWCTSFSSSIGGAIIGGGGGGIIPTDFVKKAGDSMGGLFKANFGFEAGGSKGAASIKIETVGNVTKINIFDDINISNKSILYNGNSLISASIKDVVIGSGYFTGVSLSGAALKNVSSATVSDGVSSTVILPGSVSIGGNIVFHTGNANLETVSWKTLDLSVSGNASIVGSASVSGGVSGSGGFTFSVSGKQSIASSINGELEIFQGILVKSEKSIIFANGSSINENKSGFLTIGSHLSLALSAGVGSNIRLMSSLANDNGDLEVINKFGAANFVRGANLGVNDTVTLRSKSFGNGVFDKGVEVLNFIKFIGKDSGVASFAANSISFIINQTSTLGVSSRDNLIRFDLASELNIEKYLFDREVLTTSKFSVFNSASNATATYLGDKILYLGDNNDESLLIGHYFMNTNAGIVFNGDLITDDFCVRSRDFSEGLYGTGTSIDFYKSTVTSDYLVVRKKMRVLEFEIMKTTTTNGDLFVSSSCAGDYVTEIL